MIIVDPNLLRVRQVARRRNRHLAYRPYRTHIPIRIPNRRGPSYLVYENYVNDLIKALILALPP